MLGKRLFSAGIIFVFLVVILGFYNVPFLLNIAVGVLSATAVYEALIITKYIEGKALIAISMILAFTMPILPHLIDFIGISGFTIGRVMTIAIFLFTMVMFVSMIFSYGKFSFEHIAVMFLLTVIISFFFTTLIYVRMISHSNLNGILTDFGVYYIYFVFLGAWGSDVFAYFFGKLFGKHKLVPKISPNKTIEGSVGAIISTGLVFLLASFLVSKYFGITANYGLFTITGILASIIGQIGDLSASIIKRNFSVKDFGKILPGHGGILDRFDSVIFVSPALFILFTTFNFFS